MNNIGDLFTDESVLKAVSGKEIKGANEIGKFLYEYGYEVFKSGFAIGAASVIVTGTVGAIGYKVVKKIKSKRQSTKQNEEKVEAE
jgi:hypothetical protein